MDYFAPEDLVYKAARVAVSQIGNPFGEEDFTYYLNRDGRVIDHIRPQPHRTISPGKQNLILLFEAKINEEFRRLCQSAQLRSN